MSKQKRIKKEDLDLLVYNSANNHSKFIDGCTDMHLWNKFSNNNWETILLNDRDEDYCNICDEYKGFELLNSSNLEKLLLTTDRKKFYKYFDKYDSWKMIFGNSWINLIRSDESFFKECEDHEGFINFDQFDWAELAVMDSKYIELLNKYDVWNKFNGYSWADLLIAYPYMIKDDEKYSITKKINEYGKFLWFKLLMFNSNYIKYCNQYNAWESFFKEYWVEILIKYPELINKCKIMNEFSESDWNRIIKYQPTLARKYALHHNFRVNRTETNKNN